MSKERRSPSIHKEEGCDARSAAPTLRRAAQPSREGSLLSARLTPLQASTLGGLPAPTTRRPHALGRLAARRTVRGWNRSRSRLTLGDAE